VINAPIADQVAALALRNVRKSQAEPRRPLYPHQVPPPDPWDIWLLLGGRGAGKTEGGARFVNAHALGTPCIPGKTPHRIAVVAPSHDDAVNTCVRGETGLLQANRSIRFRPGAQLSADLTWPNGAEAELFGTFAPEDVERFRGPQHCLIWGEEFAAWRKLDEAWDMIEFGLRLGPHPRMVLTTTPKRRVRLKEVMGRPGTVISRAKTSDNPGLPQERRDALYKRYGGTPIGRQELDAELIEDVPGALWTRNLIKYAEVVRTLVKGKPVPDLERIVVAIDPAVTNTADSDETGIVVDGKGGDGKGYTLADLSGHYSPTDWAKAALRAYRDYGADRIVAEANNGGDLVETVIRQVVIDEGTPGELRGSHVPITLVHASRGKRTRAEPVAALYEQGKWFHAEPFPELEDQQCSYTGEGIESSPDRLDAHVWAATDLFDLSDKSSAWGGGSSWGH